MSNAGCFTIISCLSVSNFNSATGITLLSKMKAIIVIKQDIRIKGRINRNKEMPADLIATISKVSPRLPNVMMLDNNIASGNTKGIQCNTTKPISFSKIIASNPFPTISSKYTQKNCRVKIKTAMVNVAKNGATKALIINMSNFLNKRIF